MTYFCIVERTKDLTTELFDIADTKDTAGRPAEKNLRIKKLKGMKKASEMIANDYGIKVKKCCGSCHNRGFDDQEQRCCLLTGKHVRGNAVCDDWSMSDGLKILGCQRGKVQRREYQLSLMEVRTSELNAMAKGKEMEPASVESIRRDFELKHGSRYLTLNFRKHSLT